MQTEVFALARSLLAAFSLLLAGRSFDVLSKCFKLVESSIRSHSKAEDTRSYEMGT
jgi:hypothetical protein